MRSGKTTRRRVGASRGSGRCRRAWQSGKSPGNEVSIVVTDQGKGFEFGKTIVDSLTSEPAGEYWYGVELMKVAIEEVSFERSSTESTTAGLCSPLFR
jgi:hypothetical protein